MTQRRLAALKRAYACMWEMAKSCPPEVKFDLLGACDELSNMIREVDEHAPHNRRRGDHGRLAP